jgi:hypothetical protein
LRKWGTYNVVDFTVPNKKNAIEERNITGNNPVTGMLLSGFCCNWLLIVLRLPDAFPDPSHHPAKFKLNFRKLRGTKEKVQGGRKMIQSRF